MKDTSDLMVWRLRDGQAAHQICTCDQHMIEFSVRTLRRKGLDNLISGEEQALGCFFTPALCWKGLTNITRSEEL